MYIFESITMIIIHLINHISFRSKAADARTSLSLDPVEVIGSIDSKMLLVTSV